MEATPLRNALRKLCVDQAWTYAVFWRLEGGANSSHLVWGEGHHEPTVASASFGVHEDDALLLKDYGVYPGTYCDDTASEGCQLDNRVSVLLENIIKPQVHVLGHRFIGCAAITGNYQWILQNEFSSDGYSPEDFEELHNQFSAGIQTVAVIPVLPYGVVQVGSCQMVMENTVFVNHVKCLFLHLGSIPGALASERNLNTVSAAEVHICELPILTEGPEDIHEKGPSFSIDTMLSSKLIFTTTPASLNQFLRPDACARMLPECSVTAGSESQSGNSRNARHYSYNLPDSAYSCGSASLGRSESFQNTDSLYPRQFGQSSGGVTAFNPLFPDCNDFSSDVTPHGVNICNNDSSASKWEHWIANTYMLQTLGNQSTSLSSCVSRPNQLLRNADKGEGSQNRQIDHSAKNVSSMGKVEKTDSTDVWFHTGNINAGMSGELVGRISENDLYDALGLESVPRQFTCNLDDEFGCEVDGRHAWELSTDFSACMTKADEGCVLDATHCSEIFSDSGHDQLLDAVVSKVNSSTIQNSDDSMSGKTALANIGSFAVDNNHPSNCRMTSAFGDQFDLHGISPALKAETAESLPVRSCNVDRIVDSSSEDAHRSQISLWMGSSQSIKNDSTSSSNTKKVVETGKSNRKRPKPGENPRPRPKDRQMIQDRVKELREIVPNGAKCSIDALLERTIKHMLFLQSVTKHADKLKETGEPKIINKEDGLLLKDNFEGGATWAFEVGSQSMTCPIIVEDLNPPRQLLVEMLCEDRGFFLEIADLIKGMGLTILKGIMEARNNKIWARFAVEANRDVTRMDIFLSLVKLLEPTALPNMTLQGVHGINSVHSLYCQSSIPATGAGSHLQ